MPTQSEARALQEIVRELPAEAEPASRGRVRGFIEEYGLALLLFGLVIVGWQIGVGVAHVPTYLVPSPSEIAHDFITDWSILSPAIWITGREVIYGMIIAVIAGVGIAVILHMSPIFRRTVYPILITSQTIPIVVLAPILVILLGYGIMPKLVIVGLFCFFPIVINGLDGLRSIDAAYIRMMLTLDASRWAIFRRVEFPGALPSFFSGIRIAATYASIGAVFGEFAGSNGGLGYVMLEAEPNLLTARIFAVVVSLTLMSLILFGLATLAEYKVCPWARRGESL